MRKLAAFIVNKRILFFAVFIVLIVLAALGIPRVKVEYDIAEYLPEGTDTTRALKIMDKEFEEFGTASFIVKNIQKPDADALAARLSAIDGVTNFTFDSESASNYKDGNALFAMYFADGAGSRSVAAYNTALKMLAESGYKYTVPTPLVNDYADTLASEMVIIIAIAAAVIIAVLLFTSKSFAEVLAFPIVFVVAAVLNMGTNFWLGTISFVSNTVCIILQLALAIDYAIILCHRFTEEKGRRPGDPKGALTAALAHAIPEIASSSLTTISGLVALMFMQLGLGFDLGMVLAKSIVFSLLTVFLFMPCILLWLTKAMDKTLHRSFVPKVRFLGKGVVKARYVVCAVFAVLFGVGAWLSQTVDYCYTQNGIDTSRPTAVMQAVEERDRIFGVSNMFAILVPKSVSPEVQRQITDVVSSEPLVTSSLGWASIALPSRTDPGKKYYLTDKIIPSDLSDITGLDGAAANVLFAMYALGNGGLQGVPVEEYEVTASDLFEYVFSNDGMTGVGEFAAYKELLEFGKSQLVGENHYRLVFNIDSAEESSETFALIERLIPAVKTIEGSAIFAGASMSAYDLNKSFAGDNILITILTVAFVFIILAFTFRSWGIPIVLVAVIQGAIFLNFSLPVVIGKNLFFFIYLIASAIQMGATIDYAILMTNRFNQCKDGVPRKTAICTAITESFPTIATSGTIMTVASFLVGFLTSDPLISSMGMTLGTGTLISVLCVLTVLPALLYVLEPVLKKTTRRKRVKAKDIHMPDPSRIPYGPDSVSDVRIGK